MQHQFLPTNLNGLEQAIKTAVKKAREETPTPNIDLQVQLDGTFHFNGEIYLKNNPVETPLVFISCNLVDPYCGINYIPNGGAQSELKMKFGTNQQESSSYTLHIPFDQLEIYQNLDARLRIRGRNLIYKTDFNIQRIK